jgi:hypothetical protein
MARLERGATADMVPDPAPAVGDLAHGRNILALRAVVLGRKRLLASSEFPLQTISPPNRR